MFKRAAIVPAAVIAALCSGAADACATISFSTPSIPAWDPINGDQIEATFTATLTRNTSSAKDARLIITDGQTGATRIAQSGPNYQILNSGGTNISYAQGTAAGVGVASSVPTFSFGSSTTLNLKVIIPANSGQDYVGGTIYTETVGYSIQCLNNGGASVSTDNVSTSNLVLSLTIPKLLSVTLAGPPMIDFGSFTQTQQRLNFSLRSTSSVNAAISTTNHNVMVRQGAVTPVPTNESIPYNLSFNGVSVPAAGLSNQNYTRAGVTGGTWPLILDLPSLPSGKLAGLYQDVITLTLTPGN